MLSKDFIKEFNNITISGICKEIGISPNNVYLGRCKSEDLLLIRRLLEYKMKSLLVVSEYYDTLREYDKRRIEVIENVRCNKD